MSKKQGVGTTNCEYVVANSKSRARSRHNLHRAPLQFIVTNSNLRARSRVNSPPLIAFVKQQADLDRIYKNTKEGMMYYIWRPKDDAIAEPVKDDNGKLFCPSHINPTKDYLRANGELEITHLADPELHKVVYEYSLYAAEALGYSYFCAGMWRLFSLMSQGEQLTISRKADTFTVELSKAVGTDVRTRRFNVAEKSLIEPVNDSNVSLLLEDLFTFVRENREILKEKDESRNDSDSEDVQEPELRDERGE